MIYDLKFSLYLIRHGESEINIIPDHIGQTPFEKLTSRGTAQAICLAESFQSLNLNPNHISLFSSTFERAASTAFHFNEKYPCECVYDERLVEYDPGDWLGKSRKDLFTPQFRLNFANSFNFGPNNGESLFHVQNRITNFLDEQIFSSASFHEKNKYVLNDDGVHCVFVFSHGGPIKVLLQYIMGFDKMFKNKVTINNCGVTKLNFNENGWNLRYLNNLGTKESIL